MPLTESNEALGPLFGHWSGDNRGLLFRSDASTVNLRTVLIRRLPCCSSMRFSIFQERLWILFFNITAIPHNYLPFFQRIRYPSVAYEADFKPRYQSCHTQKARPKFETYSRHHNGIWPTKLRRWKIVSLAPCIWYPLDNISIFGDAKKFEATRNM